MKNLFLICLIGFVPISMVFGQGFGVYLGVQYGSFSMNDLKEFQNTVSRTIALPLDKLEQFPGHSGLEIGITTTITDKYHFEAYYNYISTGGRLFLEDYSGKVYFDQIIKGNSTGLHSKLKINQSETFHVFLGLRTGLTFTKLSNEYYLKLEGITIPENEITYFKSINGHFSPSFSMEKEIGRLFTFGEIRYEFHIKGKLKSKENSDYYLVDSSENPIKADWNGFRMMLGVGFSF